MVFVAVVWWLWRWCGSVMLWYDGCGDVVVVMVVMIVMVVVVV